MSTREMISVFINVWQSFGKSLNITKTCTCLPFILDCCCFTLNPFLASWSLLKKTLKKKIFHFSLSQLCYLRSCCTVSKIFEFTPEINQQQLKLTFSTICLACFLWSQFMSRLQSGNHSNVQHLDAFTTLQCLHLPQRSGKWPCGCRSEVVAVSWEPFPLSG